MSMNINGLSSSIAKTTTAKKSVAADSASKTANTAAATATDKTDDASETKQAETEESAVYEKSEEKVNYKPDTATMEKIKADVLAQTERLRTLVSKLFAKQGEIWDNAFDFLVEIDEETRAEAQEMVSEDGYFGVKKTTERIMDFAKAISGGDPSKIDLLKDAVKEAFKNAKEIWGDEMPEITKKTYDSIMAEFDKWQNAANGTTETPNTEETPVTAE